MRIKKLDLDLIPQMKTQEVRARQRVLSRTLEGTWTALLKGRGMEFAGFRRYEYGDDASRIDWNASLRAKDVLIREFEEYKNVNVIFLIDVSDTMLFASERKLKAEYAAELSFTLANAILENGDAIGYALFSDGVKAKMLPSIGKQAIYGMAASLSDPRNYGGKKEFFSAITLINAMLKQRALIILVSDFIDMGEGWERYIRMLAQKFDLIGIMLRDPRDEELPDLGGQVLVEDPSGQDKIFVDVRDYRALYEQQARDEMVYIKGVFDAAKAGFVTVRTGADIYEPMLSYFRKRSAVIRG